MPEPGKTGSVDTMRLTRQQPSVFLLSLSLGWQTCVSPARNDPLCARRHSTSYFRSVSGPKRAQGLHALEFVTHRTHVGSNTPASTCTAPMTEYGPAAAFAAPDAVSDYVAPSPAAVTRVDARFEISGFDGGGDADLPAEVQPVVEVVDPESTYVTERWS